MCTEAPTKQPTENTVGMEVELRRVLAKYLLRRSTVVYMEPREQREKGGSHVTCAFTRCGSMARDAGAEETGVQLPTMSGTMENIGSTARDVCGLCYFSIV